MKQSRNIPKAIPAALVVSAAIICCSCQKQQDMSYEKETLKLTAELAASQTKNEELKKQLADRETKISALNKEVATLEENTAKIKTAHKEQKFDRDKIQLAFMKHVEVLKAKVEAENPGFLVESVTLERMVLPSERPFSSGVVMRVKSAQSGQAKRFRWQGFGDSKGEWKFEQDSSFNTGTSLADNTKPAQPNTPQTNPQTNPQPPVTPNRPQPIREAGNGEKIIRVPGWENDGNQANNNGGNNAGTNPPSQPRQPQLQPQPPRKPVRSTGGGNVHQIDWNNVGQ